MKVTDRKRRSRSRIALMPKKDRDFQIWCSAQIQKLTKLIKDSQS
ncbi:hypothetical protein [Burkholderia vietnamiensis]|nr:hypothetical protein [Burkholderia vietnamiensis]